MRLFKCQSCGQMLYFENRLCGKCGHKVGYLPDDDQMHAVEEQDGSWHALGAPERLYRFCTNADPALDACNWLLPQESPENFCVACRHNRTIPDVSEQENMAQWRALEVAKHRLFYTLIKLRLPLANRADDPREGLCFDFLEDMPGGKVMTGHDNGLITLALAEADDGEREKRRHQMHEPYRTPLGHFRHEIGHYYWDRLVRDSAVLEDFRALFGDERPDYDQALQRHYQEGAPANWQDQFISAYATSHPWEDFAETWAHYLHIVDTLETAHVFGVGVNPVLDQTGQLTTRVDFNPYHNGTIDQIIEAWLPVAFAVNSINRSMGQGDFYPFILSAPVIQKLGFVHDLINRLGSDKTEA